MYGPIDRIVSVTDPDGTTDFDYNGNLITITRESQDTEKIYDAFGRLTKVTDANGQEFNYTYDVLNNLTSVAHPGGLSNRTFSYNGLGWLLNEFHPETGTVSYSYFDSGRVETITKESGKVIAFDYDEIYRPISQISGTSTNRIEVDFYYDGQAIPGHSFSYANPINHRTGALVLKGDPAVEESCLAWPEYDTQGRNLRKDSILASPSITNVMGFSYDSLGNLASIDYPDGLVTANYTYGVATNLLSGVSVTGSSGTISLATTLSHNPAGGLQSFAFGNGVLTTITPDSRNRPDTWQTLIGSDYLVNNDFTYDAFGNITDIGFEHFIYDNLNRLTNANAISGRDFTYGYDANGNILSVAKAYPTESSSFTYSNNRLTGVIYDSDGNLTDDGVYTYDYDQLGQMVACGSDTYIYDALGKRVLKSVGMDSLIYSYLGEQLLATYDDNLLSYYDEIYFEGQLLARVVDDGVATDVSYAHLNHLGSPVAFTDETGAIVWPEQSGGTPYEIHHYEPFGADYADLGSPAIEQDVRFTGKLFDVSTGKNYFNARYYNGITTDTSYEMPPRFLNPDIMKGNPDESQKWNRYTYCVNNPLKYVDPDGKRVEPARIMTGNEYLQQIYTIQKSHPKWTAIQVLSYWNKSPQDIYLQAEGVGPLNSIDVKHMLRVAEISASAGYSGGIVAGHINEILLQGKRNPSYYSEEDLPSNRIGAILGSTIEEDYALSTQLRVLFESIDVNMENLENLETHKKWIENYYKDKNGKITLQYDQSVTTGY